MHTQTMDEGILDFRDPFLPPVCGPGTDGLHRFHLSSEPDLSEVVTRITSPSMHATTQTPRRARLRRCRCHGRATQTTQVVPLNGGSRVQPHTDASETIGPMQPLVVVQEDERIVGVPHVYGDACGFTGYDDHNGEKSHAVQHVAADGGADFVGDTPVERVLQCTRWHRICVPVPLIVEAAGDDLTTQAVDVPTSSGADGVENAMLPPAGCCHGPPCGASCTCPWCALFWGASSEYGNITDCSSDDERL